MNRIRLSLLLVAALLAATRTGSAEAGTLDADTMKVALHTSSVYENGFIDHVLALVDKGTLPEDLVQSTFLWAKRKPRNKFQYFKNGLTLRAEQQGIHL